MKKIRKVVAMCIAIMSAVSAISLSVAAVEKDFSSYYNSPSCRTGEWVSLRSSQCANLKSNYTKPDAGNAGVYFYTTNVGLSSNFARSKTRTGIIEVYEADLFNNDDYVCRYKGYFYERQSDGLYGMHSFSRVDTAKTPDGKVPVIETEKGVELYLKFYLEMDKDDKSQNVDAKLFMYRLWIE